VPAPPKRRALRPLRITNTFPQKLTTKWANRLPPNPRKKILDSRAHGKEEFHRNRPSGRSEEARACLPRNEAIDPIPRQWRPGEGGLFADACRWMDLDRGRAVFAGTEEGGGEPSRANGSRFLPGGLQREGGPGRCGWRMDPVCRSGVEPSTLRVGPGNLMG